MRIADHETTADYFDLSAVHAHDNPIAPDPY